jgi:hypothetical protein
VVGVNWHCEIMPLKSGGDTGLGFVSSALAALNYVVKMKVKVSNNSWGVCTHIWFADSSRFAVSAAIPLRSVLARSERVPGIKQTTGVYSVLQNLP